PACLLVADRGAAPAAASDALKPGLAHQPLDRAAGDLDAVQAQLPPHLAGPVEALGLLVDPADLDHQLCVALGPRRRLALAGLDGVVGRRGDLQRTADRLDPEASLVVVDENAHLLGGCGSSSRAKKADAALRISLARRSSRFSRSSSLIRSASTLVTPGRLPASVSA